MVVPTPHALVPMQGRANPDTPVCVQQAWSTTTHEFTAEALEGHRLCRYGLHHLQSLPCIGIELCTSIIVDLFA
jgi:hypothetical protein